MMIQTPPMFDYENAIIQEYVFLVLFTCLLFIFSKKLPISADNEFIDLDYLNNQAQDNRDLAVINVV